MLIHDFSPKNKNEDLVFIYKEIVNKRENINTVLSDITLGLLSDMKLVYGKAYTLYNLYEDLNIYFARKYIEQF